MSLGGSLQIGRSGLLTSQAALDTVGHNLANLATRGYHRQSVSLSPSDSQRISQNVAVGRGVQIDAITRQVDEALQGRLRTAIAEEAGASQHEELLRRLEAIEHEFSDADLTTQLGRFFDAWNQLADNPQDSSLRSLVTRQGQQLADFVQDLRQQMVGLRRQSEEAASAAARQVNELMEDIADLNRKIAVHEGGGGGTAGLRDQRDRALNELAEYLDISTVTQSNGQVDVYVGSEPLVLNGKSRGVELLRENVDGQTVQRLVVADDGTQLNATAGKLGALVSFRENDMAEAIDTLDRFAHELIWHVNRQHSQGQGLALRESITAEHRVADTDVPLNDPAAGLAFVPEHGSFRLHVTQESTGERKTHIIDIDLDGIDSDSDTTLHSLAGTIDAIANVTASVTADGRLEIATADSDHKLSFSEDTSGVLAALGMNSYFTGHDANDIAVRNELARTPGLLAAAQDHTAGDNTNAAAIAQLRHESSDDIAGLSLSEYWNRHVEEYGARLAAASERVVASGTVRQSLEQQQQSVSGVNVDEEAIDLIRYQRAYQASARFLSVVDEMMKTLLQSL